MARTVTERIRRGEIGKKDIQRWLAELACGRVNDCVRLALEEKPELEKLDLRLLSEVKNNGKGAVEIKLIDRLQVLRQLADMLSDGGENMEVFLQALQGGEK